MFTVGHASSKTRDDFRIGNILPLGGHRHHQMLFHQPRQQFRISGGNIMRDAEFANVISTQDGVIATATLTMGN